MDQRIPLLILSDAPSASTGLGRITRDIAKRVATELAAQFDVATLGYGGIGDRTLPFFQYTIESMNNWFIPTLKDVWEDHAKGRKGVLMSIWDATRILWIARPEAACSDKQMQEWLLSKPFQKWGYFPIDAVGPHGKLSCMQRECLMGFDRVMAYTSWGEQIISGSLSREESVERDLTFLPHGIDTSVFYRRDKKKARALFHGVMGFKGPPLRDEELLIGIVATNQARKDYGLAIQAVAELATTVPVRLFIQTDALERYWSIPNLLMDYGLVPQAIVNCGELPDDLMAQLYTACDVTLGIGAGEGFGFPIFESMACGTPCVTGAYGGQCEFMPDTMLIEPGGMRLEGLFNCFRPVYQPRKWANKINAVAGQRAELPKGLDWARLWPHWKTWFERGYQLPWPMKCPNAKPICSKGE